MAKTCQVAVMICLLVFISDAVGQTPQLDVSSYKREFTSHFVMGKSGARLYGTNALTNQYSFSDDNGFVWHDTGDPSTPGVFQLLFQNGYQFALTAYGTIFRNNSDVFTGWTEISV